MPLTKARPPVTAISQLINGTTDINIATAGGNIDVNVNGLDVVDLASTTITIDDLVTLVANTITGETLTQSTSGGATMRARTTASQGELETTSNHPVVLGANSTDALTLRTDGEVTLANVGTLAASLVDKNYVDTQVGNQVAASDITANQTATGSLSIPTSTGNDMILNWGITASLSKGSGATAQTFDTAYPNAVFSIVTARINSSVGAEASANVNNVSLTGFDFIPTYTAASQAYWLAIGY